MCCLWEHSGESTFPRISTENWLGEQNRQCALLFNSKYHKTVTETHTHSTRCNIELNFCPFDSCFPLPLILFTRTSANFNSETTRASHEVSKSSSSLTSDRTARRRKNMRKLTVQNTRTNLSVKYHRFHTDVNGQLHTHFKLEKVLSLRDYIYRESSCRKFRRRRVRFSKGQNFTGAIAFHDTGRSSSHALQVPVDDR